MRGDREVRATHRARLDRSIAIEWNTSQLLGLPNRALSGPPKPLTQA